MIEQELLRDEQGIEMTDEGNVTSSTSRQRAPHTSAGKRE